MHGASTSYDKNKMIFRTYYMCGFSYYKKSKFITDISHRDVI